MPSTLKIYNYIGLTRFLLLAFNLNKLPLRHLKKSLNQNLIWQMYLRN